MTGSAISQGSDIYVNASAPPGGTGFDWANAFNDLNAGLAKAATLQPVLPANGPNPAVVHVAAGDYYPSYQQPGTGTAPEGRTFRVARGVIVIGGYPATGNPFSPDPDLARHTTLHGDLKVTPAAKANNVVTCTSLPLGTLDENDPSTMNDLTWIQNFVIQYGRANGIPNNNGAGMHASPPSGGYPIDLRLDRVTFLSNAAAQAGGGLFYSGVDEPIGIGMFLCNFINNAAGEQGGGAWLGNLGSWTTSSFSQPSWIYNCLYTGNFAGFGSDASSLGKQAGGALFLYDHDNLPILANDLFVRNSVNGRGSAIALRPARGAGYWEISDSTFSQNTVLTGPPGSAGGTLWLDLPTVQGTNSVNIFNTILWDNNDVIPGNNDILGNTTKVVQYCDVTWSPTSATYPGTGNINKNPAFDNPFALGFTLNSGSPCIDRGNSALLPPDYPNNLPVILYDFRNDTVLWPRVTDYVSAPNVPTALDMGCYEANP